MFILNKLYYRLGPVLHFIIKMLIKNQNIFDIPLYKTFVVLMLSMASVNCRNYRHKQYILSGSYDTFYYLLLSGDAKNKSTQFRIVSLNS